MGLVGLEFREVKDCFLNIIVTCINDFVLFKQSLRTPFS